MIDTSKLRRVITCLTLIATAAVCAVFGDDIPFQQQWPLYEALRTTSGIVFGVLGAWIALVYPSGLKKMFEKEQLRSRDLQSISSDIQRLNSLLTPMRWSTIILLTVIAVGIIAPVAKQISFLLEYRGAVRSLSFALLGVATIGQFWTVLLVVAPAENLEIEARIAEERSRRLSVLRADQQTGQPRHDQSDVRRSEKAPVP